MIATDSATVIATFSAKDSAARSHQRPWPARTATRWLQTSGCAALAGALWFAGMASALAQTPDAAAEPPPPQLGPGAEQMAETTRRSVRATADWLARGVDSWFADQPGSSGQARVREGELRLRSYKRQDQSLDVDLRFDARFDLPHAERSTYLYFGRDDERDVVTDQPGSVKKLQPLRQGGAAESGAFFAGLGRLITDDIDLRAGFRGGLNPYVQVRYRRGWRLGEATRAEFRESLFASAEDKLGSTTAFAVDHLFTPRWHLRWITAATITQDTGRFEWYSNLGLVRSFGHQRQLAVELLTNDIEGSGPGLTDYGVQLRWEQPLHRDWLIGEVMMGHFWPRPEAAVQRERAWAVGLGLRLRI